jgi:hypothetical protein
MTQNTDDNKEDRRDRFNKRRDDTARGGVPEPTPHIRRTPYRREHVDYDYYLQEEALEDDWFDKNN